jgi:hypothetical protein
LRLANLVPFNFGHIALDHIDNVAGFRLEKGTHIVAQISNVLFDEKVKKGIFGDWL